MPFLICLLLLLSLNTSCASADISLEITPPLVKGNTPNDTEVSIFDGITLKPIKISNGRFREEHTITSGYYGVLFFTRQGFYPEILVFKVKDEPIRINKISLKPLKEPQKGILTGVIYKPVRGGKLREHKGIFQTFKNEKINLIKDDKEKVSYDVATDDNGIFMIELIPGEYSVVFNNREAGKVHIERGKTTIKNIQKGAVLID